MREFWIIQTINGQERQMCQQNKNRFNDRIVSISQTHVKPIVRGKQGKKVEFGSKLGLSLSNGFVKSDTLSWEPYNESADLKKQAEAYRCLYGYYPEIIQADQIYATNENRKWTKERDIRLTAKPKGKPKKLTSYQKSKSKKEYARRNQIEGKIGQSKNGYGFNKIKAKLKNSSESWIGIILFIVDIIKFAEIQRFHF